MPTHRSGRFRSLLLASLVATVALWFAAAAATNDLTELSASDGGTSDPTADPAEVDTTRGTTTSTDRGGPTSVAPLDSTPTTADPLGASSALPPTSADAGETTATDLSATPGPAISEPSISDPAIDDPANSDPATTKPTVTTPATADNALTDPAAGDPLTDDPAADDRAGPESTTVADQTTIAGGEDAGEGGDDVVGNDVVGNDVVGDGGEQEGGRGTAAADDATASGEEESSASSLIRTILGLAIIGLAIAGVLSLAVPAATALAERWRSRQRGERGERESLLAFLRRLLFGRGFDDEDDHDPNAFVGIDPVVVLDRLQRELQTEAHPRQAVRRAYAAAESGFGDASLARRRSETPTDYLQRLLGAVEGGGEGDSATELSALTTLFLLARYSDHEITEAMRGEAIDAVLDLRRRYRQPAARARQEAVLV